MVDRLQIRLQRDYVGLNDVKRSVVGEACQHANMRNAPTAQQQICTAEINTCLCSTQQPQNAMIPECVERRRRDGYGYRISVEMSWIADRARRSGRRRRPWWCRQLHRSSVLSPLVVQIEDTVNATNAERARIGRALLPVRRSLLHCVCCAAKARGGAVLCCCRLVGS